MGVTYSQLFPPKPDLTEENLPTQHGKVFLITGATSGVGFELAAMLYEKGAKVYVSGRSKDSVSNAIEKIKTLKKAGQSPETLGRLQPFVIDLSHLAAIKPAVDALLAKETHLDVLWLNAGVSQPPAGSKTKQGYEVQMGVNCLASFLLAELLLPLLKSTAAARNSIASGSVRIVWTSSQMVELSAPRGGFEMKDIRSPPRDNVKNYTNSKTGNYFLARHFSKKVRSDGILSIAQNPGNLKTNILRNARWMAVMSSPLLHPQKMGAYTELYAGLSPELTTADGESYVIPWGRKHPGFRADLVAAADGKISEEFYAWCDEQVAPFR